MKALITDYTNQTTLYANFRCLPFVSFATVTGPPPVMSLNCQRVWDASGHFNISLNWSFPDASQISHITQFVVTPVLQNSGPIRNSYHLTRTEVRELNNTLVSSIIIILYVSIFTCVLCYGSY